MLQTYASSSQKATITSFSYWCEPLTGYDPRLVIAVSGNKTSGSSYLQQEIGYELYDANNTLVYRGVQRSNYAIKVGESFTVNIYYNLPRNVYTGTYKLKIVNTDL